MTRVGNISCQWRELGICITITGGFLEYVLQSGAGVCSGFFQKHFKLMLENFRFGLKKKVYTKDVRQGKSFQKCTHL